MMNDAAPTRCRRTGGTTPKGSRTNAATAPPGRSQGFERYLKGFVLPNAWCRENSHLAIVPVPALCHGTLAAPVFRAIPRFLSKRYLSANPLPPVRIRVAPPKLINSRKARNRLFQTVSGIFLPNSRYRPNTHFVPQCSVLFRVVPFCLCQSCARKFLPYSRKPLVSLDFWPLFRFRCAVAQAWHSLTRQLRQTLQNAHLGPALPAKRPSPIPVGKRKRGEYKRGKRIRVTRVNL